MLRDSKVRTRARTLATAGAEPYSQNRFADTKLELSSKEQAFLGETELETCLP